MIGISIKKTIGVGDALQYSSLPENYFRHTEQKLIDVSHPWFFDHNPFVIRDPNVKPHKTVEMWNYSPTQYNFPIPRKGKPEVYLSNAEIWAAVLGVPCVLNRPRIYRFEDYPFEEREMIFLQTLGASHGEMPEHIVEHVINKYAPTKNIFHVGPGKTYGLPSIGVKETLWDLAEILARARMIICLDSGPAWIGACYPDVIVKKVRTKPNPPDEFAKWIPLEIRNIHSHWDSREHMIYNVSDKDYGFTWSYKRI